ncbi:MAG: hypothetical protein KDB27_19415 [Planctomycetales bacterium]|nr:hypothetical protein [Planctomycetales bacterium]
MDDDKQDINAYQSPKSDSSSKPRNISGRELFVLVLVSCFLGGLGFVVTCAGYFFYDFLGGGLFTDYQATVSFAVCASIGIIAAATTFMIFRRWTSHRRRPPS